MLKMSKLKKMKMPEKKGPEEELDMEGMEEQSPELEAAEEDMGMDLDMDMEAGEPAEHKEAVLGADLEAISDEDLLAELKKRGLSKELEGEEEVEDDERSIMA